MNKKAKAYDEALEKQGKRKPVEWSEEDENHRKDTILAIQEYRADCIKKYGKDPAWADCVDWLKSLPKQEWNEEEEKAEDDSGEGSDGSGGE